MFSPHNVRLCFKTGYFINNNPLTDSFAIVVHLWPLFYNSAGASVIAQLQVGYSRRGPLKAAETKKLPIRRPIVSLESAG
jgi:hypothetical protein